MMIQPSWLVVLVLALVCLGINAGTQYYTEPKPLTVDVKTKYSARNEIVYRLYQLVVLSSRRVLWTHSFLCAVGGSLLLCGLFRHHNANAFVAVLFALFAALEVPRRWVTVHVKARNETVAAYLHAATLCSTANRTQQQAALLMSKDHADKADDGDGASEADRVDEADVHTTVST